MGFGFFGHQFRSFVCTFVLQSATWYMSLEFVFCHMSVILNFVRSQSQQATIYMYMHIYIYIYIMYYMNNKMIIPDVRVIIRLVQAGGKPMRGAYQMLPH